MVLFRHENQQPGAMADDDFKSLKKNIHSFRNLYLCKDNVMVVDQIRVGLVGIRDYRLGAVHMSRASPANRASRKSLLLNNITSYLA